MILEHVVRAGDIAGLQKLLTSASSAVFEERDKNERTALMLAVIGGNLDILQIVLKAGARTSCRDKWGKTALMYAVQKGSVEVLTMLLKFHADVNDFDNSGKTVEEHISSTCRRKEEIARILHEAKLRHLRRTGSFPDGDDMSSDGSPTGSPQRFPASASSSPTKRSPLKRGAPTAIAGTADNSPKADPPEFSVEKDILDFARRGYNDGLRLLLPQAGGVTVDGLNARDRMGRTPLMVALLNGKTDSMRLILDAGAETRCFDNAGKSVVFYAISKRNMEALEMLLAAKTNIAVTDSHGRTPFMEACMDANIPALRALLAAGASTRPKDDKGRTALMYAVAKGNIEMINLLIDAGADVSAVDSSGKTVEDYGISTLLFDQVSKLIRNAMETQKRNVKKGTLHRLNSMPDGPECEDDGGTSPVKKMLVRSRSQQQVLSPWNPLANKSALEMVRTNDKKGLLVLLAGGLSEVGINERDAKGRTAIMVACIYEKEELLRILLDHGADLEAKDNVSIEQPMYLLVKALRNSCPEQYPIRIPSLLWHFKFRFIACMCDQQGKTVLFHAVSTGDILCMRALIIAGATPNTTDSFGRTPLIQACIFGNVAAMEEFLRCEVNVDATDMWGKTALMYATAKGDLQAIRVLLDASANVDAVDIIGKCVEEYGLSVRNFEAVRRALQEERDRRKFRADSSHVTHTVRATLNRASSMPLAPMMQPVGILDLARKGDRDSIRTALAKDSSSVVVNDRDKNNRTPLILACLHSKRDVMDELISTGAYPNQKDRWGKSALMYAVSKGDAEAVQMLLDARADPFDVDYESRTVEEQALAGGRNCEEVLHLISKAKERITTDNPHAAGVGHGSPSKDDEFGDTEGPAEGWVDNYDEPTTPGTTPDYRVAAPGVLDLARKGDGYSMRVALLKDCSSVVVDEQDKNGRTPLMLACMYAKRDSIQELIRVGANVHMYDKWGKTALMYASSKGDLRATQMLLDAGANPHDTDWEGKSADEHLLCSARCYEAIMQILRQAKRKTTPLKKQASFGFGGGLRRLNSKSSPSTSPCPDHSPTQSRSKKQKRLVSQQSAPPSLATLSLLNKTNEGAAEQQPENEKNTITAAVLSSTEATPSLLE